MRTGYLGTPTPPPPPLPAYAAPAPTYSEATAAATGTAIRVRSFPRVLRGPLNGIFIFLGPAGLADGLAPKEQRYGPSGPDSPRDDGSTPPHWFPRSPSAWPPGIRQFLLAAAEYPRPRRRPIPSVRLANA